MIGDRARASLDVDDHAAVFQRILGGQRGAFGKVAANLRLLAKREISADERLSLRNHGSKQVY